MKNLLLSLCMIFSLAACNEDDNKEQYSMVIGSWLLTEIYGSDGGQGSWNGVENGFVYTFNSDMTFTSTRFSECTYGDYSVTDNLLTLKFGCEEFDTGIENPPGTFIEAMSFEGEALILSPTYMNCDEGCSYKFKRIKNE